MYIAFLKKNILIPLVVVSPFIIQPNDFPRISTCFICADPQFRFIIRSNKEGVIARFRSLKKYARANKNFYFPYIIIIVKI